MLLKKIKVENFKKFRELEREFVPGINVVRGMQNEMGKSTLLQGIVTALFENPRSTRKELESYNTWGSVRKCKTVIDFDAQGMKYILEKDFDARSMRLAAVDTGKEWNTPKEISEKLQELLGTDSAILFQSTSCILQNQITAIQSGSREIDTSLEGLLTGGTEDTVASQVIDKLVKQISALTRGMEKLATSPGPIASLTRQINNLQTELLLIKGEVAKVESQKLMLVRVTEELAEKETKIAEVEALLEKNKRRGQIEATIGTVEAEYKKIDTLVNDIEALQKQIQSAESELQTVSGFADLNMVQERKNFLQKLEITRQGINEDLPKRKAELATAEEYFKRNSLLVDLTSKTALIVVAAVAVMAVLPSIFFDIRFLLISIIGLIFLVGIMWGRSYLAQHRARVSDLQGRMAQMGNALTDIGKQESDALSQVNCSSVAEFRSKEEKYTRVMVQKNNLQNQLVGKLGGRKFEQIEEEKRSAARKLGVEREKLTDDLKSTKISPEDYVRREKQLKQLGDEKKRLEVGRMGCELGIKDARFNPDDQAQMEEKLASLAGDLRQEQKKARVYQLARDIVSLAREETLAHARDILQAQIQKNFEIFTNGKYKKVNVMVGKESIDFQIYSEEKGDWASPGELSGGVNDELYLACRIALVCVLYGETKPPLILDDPFTNFDQPRLARTLEFLKQLSREYQIILFSLNNAYDNIADRVIELT